MSRKHREMDEGAGPVASAIDTFAGALGAAIAMLLMLLTMTRNPYQQDGPGARVPTLLTLTWNAKEPVAGGLGPCRLQLRVRKPDGSVEYFRTEGTAPAEPLFATWEISESRGQRWNKFGEPDQTRTLASVTWTAGELPRNTQWEVEARLTCEAPIDGRPAVQEDPYFRLLEEVEQAWGAFHAGAVDTAGLRGRLTRAHDAYTAFHSALTEFNAACKEAEANAEPGDKGAPAVNAARMKAAARVLDSTKSWTYPAANVHARFHRDGRPQAVAFESQLTKWILSEFPSGVGVGTTRASTPPRPADTLNPAQIRYRFLRAVREASAESFTADVDLSFTAPGAKERIAERYDLSNLLGPSGSRGWFPVAALRVDDHGRVEFTPRLQRSDADKPQPDVSPLPVTAQTAWDDAAATFDALGAGDSVGESRPVLDRVDAALRFLASKQAPNGSFNDEKPEYVGAGTTGLALMAFRARGHEVGLAKSEFKDVTEKATNYVCAAAAKGEYGTANAAAYQMGFALLALADVHPGAAKNSPELAARIEMALKKAVRDSVAAQNKNEKDKGCGGWGYDAAKNDTSVAAVHVKGLAEARSVLTGAEDRKLIDEALGRALKFYQSAREPSAGFYHYRVPPDDPKNDKPHRQPGSLLAEHTCRHLERTPFPAPGAGTFERKILDRLDAWVTEVAMKPAEFARDGTPHYALFYGTLLMSLHEQPKVREGWYRRVRELMLKVGQDTKDDSFKGGTYGTAMTIIQLMTPFQANLRERLANR